MLSAFVRVRPFIGRVPEEISLPNHQSSLYLVSLETRTKSLYDHISSVFRHKAWHKPRSDDTIPFISILNGSRISVIHMQAEIQVFPSTLRNFYSRVSCRGISTLADRHGYSNAKEDTIFTSRGHFNTL